MSPFEDGSLGGESSQVHSGLFLDASSIQISEGQLETWLQLGTLVLARAAEVIAALVIAVGVFTALFSWAESRLRGRDAVSTDGIGRIEKIRLELGRALSLGLEFLLAADILSTAVAPTWDAIGKLAAIATIRTLLNYFLGRELRQEEQRRLAWQQDPQVGATPADNGRPKVEA